jgi:hypothetical protein
MKADIIIRALANYAQRFCRKFDFADYALHEDSMTMLRKL